MQAQWEQRERLYPDISLQHPADTMLAIVNDQVYESRKRLEKEPSPDPYALRDCFVWKAFDRLSEDTRLSLALYFAGERGKTHPEQIELYSATLVTSTILSRAEPGCQIGNLVI